MSDTTDEVYEMSDEDFLKLGSSAFKPEPEPATDDKAVTADDNDSVDNSNDDSQRDDEVTDQGTESQEEDGDAAVDKAPEDAKDEKADETTPKPDDKAVDGPTDAEYANIGRQIMSEFKANGTTLKMKSVDDAIQLMQMGANYHKKMAGLKPSLKTLKLLENNGLLDPEKLSYLIDLSQKKPEAITQLLKDSKIDPMTIDLDTENTYVPPQRTVNDTDLLLDEVLDSISESPAYSKTLTVLGDEWDANSRTFVAKNPEIIRAINAHIESGIYDQVVSAVAYEKSLGKLVGLSDLDAYQRVGAYMHENNLFTSSANASPPNDKPGQTKIVPTAQKESDEQSKNRLDRKQAASPSRQQKVVTKDTSNYNPLEMSDEEFIKLNQLRI